MHPLGIGILGSGFMGRTYAESISKHCPEAQVKAVAGGSRAGQLAADYGLICEPSAEALVARDDLDVVFVTTPHHLHAAHALAAAEAGKHVMLEKPMACSVADCDAILQACSERQLQCSVAFTQRSRKCNFKAKELLDSGQLGRIQQMFEWQFFSGGAAAFPKWQAEADNLGILFGHGIHNLDRIRWLTGAEIATVYAKCGGLDDQSRVEGTSMVLMTLTNGAAVTLWCSGRMPRPSFPRSQFSCWIVAQEGLIDLDAYGELRVARQGRWEVAEVQEPIDWQGKGAMDPVRLASFTRHCREFFAAIQTGTPCPVSGWDGRQAVAAALAAYESSRTGKEVVLG